MIINNFIAYQYILQQYEGPEQFWLVRLFDNLLHTLRKHVQALFKNALFILCIKNSPPCEINGMISTSSGKILLLVVATTHIITLRNMLYLLLGTSFQVLSNSSCENQ